MKKNKEENKKEDEKLYIFELSPWPIYREANSY
jgi:hypothetical protein